MAREYSPVCLEMAPYGGGWQLTALGDGEETSGESRPELALFKDEPDLFVTIGSIAGLGVIPRKRRDTILEALLDRNFGSRAGALCCFCDLSLLDRVSRLQFFRASS